MSRENLNKCDQESPEFTTAHLKCHWVHSEMTELLREGVWGNIGGRRRGKIKKPVRTEISRAHASFSGGPTGSPPAGVTHLSLVKCVHKVMWNKGPLGQTQPSLTLYLPLGLPRQVTAVVLTHW